MSINNGIINDYTLKPRNLTQYTAFRGVTDFTQIGQFAQFESGYSFLSVIQMPEFLRVLSEQDASIKSLCDSFKHTLEYEFRGLDGLPDLQGDTYDITDGINTQRLINKVTWDTSVSVTMNFFEKSGGLLTKFCEYYLTGIKDRISQAKTYHGLIKQNLLQPGPENEVFTMMYYVTDNTMLNIERAVLLCNCQITGSRLSDVLNSTKGEINNKEIGIEFNCFPVMGYEVDKAANKLIADITGVKTGPSAEGPGRRTYSIVAEEGTVATDGNGNKITVASLDSNNYKYGIMNSADTSGTKIESLVSAIEGATLA